MALIPIGDRVILKYYETEDRTASGIVLPDSTKEKTQAGEIISVGSGKIVDGKTVPVPLNVGDKVSYGKYTGTEIKHDNEKYLVINADDIIAVVKD